MDWTAYLAELGAGVTISVSTWAVSPDGLTLGTPSIVAGSLKTQILISGGRLDRRYTVSNHITTSTGVEDDRSFDVVVQQR
jgi:hypothetical protein